MAEVGGVDRDDPISAAINRLPGVIQEDVHRFLALRNMALARAHEPEVWNDDEAVVAASAIADAYDAALRSISTAFDEPDLDLNSNEAEDEPESFDGSLNIDAGSPAPAFPPFLQSQLDRRADAMKEKRAR
jgi:hypothetical protein